MPIRNQKGHWQDKKGNFIHPDMVPVDKKLETELVENLVRRAELKHESLSRFKAQAFAECYDYMDLLRQNYEMERLQNSRTGAVTFKSFDGVCEVQIAVAKLISFDAKLTLAKEKLDEYFTEKTEHADPEIQTLINRVFEVKNGRVDAKQILSLKQYPITAPKWKEAMALIDQATEIAGTKSYIRFKKRVGGVIDGPLETIVMDMAAIDLAEEDIELQRQPEKETE